MLEVLEYFLFVLIFVLYLNRMLACSELECSILLKMLLLYMKTKQRICVAMCTQHELEDSKSYPDIMCYKNSCGRIEICLNYNVQSLLG